MNEPAPSPKLEIICDIHNDRMLLSIESYDEAARRIIEAHAQKNGLPFSEAEEQMKDYWLSLYASSVTEFMQEVQPKIGQPLELGSPEDINKLANNHRDARHRVLRNAGFAHLLTKNS